MILYGAGPPVSYAHQDLAHGIAMADPIISKSKYLWGLQCDKLLWHAYHRKDLLPTPEPELLELFRRGHDVGRLARRLFHGGIEIAPDTHDVHRVAEASRLALETRRPLFEAGFIHDGAYARADILCPNGRAGWDVIEVKNSPKVHEVHLHDLALQQTVYAGAGLQIRRCFIMHIAPGADPERETDPRRLFRLTDVSTAVAALSPAVPTAVASMHALLHRHEMPAVPPGPQCRRPYTCPLFTVCHAPHAGERPADPQPATAASKDAGGPPAR